MKKKNWRIYSLIAFLFLVLSGWRMYAEAAGTVTIFIDQKSLNVEDTLKVTVQTSEPEDDAIPPEVTLTYDNSLLEFTYCSEEYGGGEGGLITLHSTTANLTFVAKKAGTASLNAEAIIDGDGNNKVTASRSVSIGGTETSENGDGQNDEETADNTKETEEPDQTDDAENEDDNDTDNEAKVLSSDATLKKFKVDDAKLTPKFSKDVTDYTVTLKADVPQLLFTAKTSDANARISGCFGFANLKNGSNKAVINVLAEDGTQKTYTFTIMKEGNAASTEDTSQRECVEAVNGYIAVEDSNLFVNTTFPDEFVPEGFAKVDYIYKEQIVEAAGLEMGGMLLLYLSGDDGSMGDFYIYYSGTDEFTDFIQIKGAEGHFISPINFPVGIVVPDGFQDSAMQWNDKMVSAFMVSQNNDEESDAFESTTEVDSQTESGDKPGTEMVDEQMQQGNQYAQPEDFYLFYAMNQDGGEGFYLYDSLEGTYQRYLDMTVEESATGSFDEESYVIYKEKSQKRMVVIGILIVVVVILCFLLLNMFLKIRELQAGLDDEDDEDNPDDKENGNGIPSKDAVFVKKEAKQRRTTEKKQEKNKEKKRENPVAKVKKKTSLPEKPAKESVKKTVSGKMEKEGKNEVSVAEKRSGSNREAKPNRRPAPVMFDLSTPKVDGNLTPKMQREQLDDDFEFEFINIDE